MNGMQLPRILFIERPEKSDSLARQALEQEGMAFAGQRVSPGDAFVRGLETFAPQLVISSAACPDSDALTALERARSHDPALPFLFFTATPDADAAVQFMKAGATDYIAQKKPSRLVTAVREALEPKKPPPAPPASKTVPAPATGLAALMENFNGMVYRCKNDSLWTMEFISPGVEQLTGYRAADLINNRTVAYAHLIHPEDQKMVWETVQAATSEGAPFTCQYRITDKNGREKWVWEQGRQVKGEPGAVEGLIADITGHKRTEQALHLSEKRYRFLAENISDIILASDAEGNYTYISPSHYHLLGRGEEVLGRSLFEHIHPEDIPGVQQIFADAFASGAEAKATYRYLHPTRGYIWLESTGRRHTDADKTPGAIITSRDISERKWAEEALQISEAKFRSIFDFSYQAIALTEAETGKLVEVNNKFVELTGYTRAEVLGRTTTELGFYSSADRERFIREIRAAGELNGLEMDFKAKDGSILNAMMFARSLEISGRAYILTLFLNLTEQKQLEAQLRQSQKMEAVGRLAGGVAHDFNNMLSVILGYAEMALAELPQNSMIHKQIHEIHKAAERSTALVRQLLTFSRKQTVEPRALNLNQAVEDHKRMLDRLIGENVNIEFKPAKDLWHIRIDPAQIDQILANLAVNARDAISEFGSVRIETANHVAQKTETSPYTTALPGEYVMLAFSDNGEGMDSQTLEKIFEPFFTTKEKDRGTGLGLATLYGIVTQNEGHIRVDSAPGKGSRFALYFPRHKGDPASFVAPQANGDLSGHETILIVEDQAQVLKFTQMLLEKNGYSVLTASTPTEALQICRQTDQPIALLLTDVIMPEMNGKELKERIAELTPGIRALYMSGYTEDVIAQNGIVDTNIEFIQKPFSNRELASKIRQVLNQ